MTDRVFTQHFIKLLALDLDGTLLTTDKHLTARTRSCLLSALDAGIEIVYVTGRPLSGLPEELLQIPGTRYIITSNGAVTFDRKQNRQLRSCLIRQETARQIIQLPAVRNRIYNVFIDGMGYCSPEVYKRMLDLFTGTPQEAYVRQSRQPAENLQDLIAHSDTGVENIWIRGTDQAERDRINGEILMHASLKTVLTARTDVEAGAKGADKGLALEHLANRLHIEKQHILAIGDNENDLGMFQTAGLSVAMGNASDSVKKQADSITASNDQDGVAEAVERYLHANP